MVYLEYEKTKLPVLDGYNITKSSQEIAYSDLKCDFTGRTAVELPQKYEEVKVVEERYVDTIIEEPIEKTIEDFKNTTFETKVDSEIEITKIKGEHRQATREGYQLLNLQSGMQNGITYYVDDEGYFCISGTCTSDRIILNLNELVLNGIYTFTNKSISGGEINCVLKDNTPKYGNVFTKNNETKEVNTILKDLVCYLTNGVTYNSKIKLMLVSGSQEKDIEQYGVMPSPDYPSEIETVGSNVNELKLKNGKSIKAYGLDVSIDNGIITINGTANDYYPTFLISGDGEIETRLGTPNINDNPNWYNSIALAKRDYTLKFEYISGDGGNAYRPYVFIHTSDGENLEFSQGNSTKIKNYTGEIAGISFYVEKNQTFNNYKFRVYVVKGTYTKDTIPPYLPYGMGSVEKDVVNKNFFDKNKALRGYELNGTTGQTSSNSLFFTSDYIRVNPNDQYFLSGKHDGTSNCFYDKNKRYIDKVVLKNGLLTVPDNSDIYYLRINARLTSIDTTMIEKGTEKTDYVEGQSQSIIMPIQQEMLEGDYIKDVEYHEWTKLIFTGDEDISLENSYQGIYQFGFVNNAKWENDDKIRAISNYYKGVMYNNSWAVDNCTTPIGGGKVGIMTSQYTTVDSFKAFLKSKYDEGNPVIVYYKLAEPINLELIDEQKKGLKKVQVKNGINHVTSEASISVKYTEDMIPKKQKRIKQNLLCYGYVDNYVFPELREQDKDIDINFTLLSPSKMSTLRTCTAVGTYKLKELLEKVILKPLLDDGFNLKELNVTDRSVTVNFLCKTLEYCLNNLSNKFNIWCNIDEQKNIYIKDIELIWNEGKIKHIYDDEHSIRGLQYIKPSTSSDDYANVINFTNVRIYEYSRVEFSDSNMKIMTQNFNPLIVEQISNIKNGEQIALEIPVDIKKENILKSVYSRGESDGNAAALRLGGVYTDNTVFNISILYDKEKDTVVLSDNLGIENEEGKDKEFLLIKDSFFSNLIVGIKYNGQKTLKAIKYISSDSVLVWSINKFYNNKAINEEKNRISKTGIVETTVDMKESWKTAQELREIGTTYMNKNGLKLDGQVELKTDEDVFKVGDTIKINKMIVNGVYVVTDIQIDCSNNDLEYIVTCKNANMLSSFIDIFRSEDTQETNDKTYHLYLTHYNQEEFAESHEVIQ